jgi:hypothetical protein
MKIGQRNLKKKTPEIKSSREKCQHRELLGARTEDRAKTKKQIRSLPLSKRRRHPGGMLLTGPNPEDGVSSSNKQQGSRVTRRTKMRLKSQTEIPGWRRKRCIDWEIRKQRITTAKPRPPLAAADSQKRKSVEKKS